MKDTDNLDSSYDSELHGPAPDVRVEEAFKAKVFSLLICALIGRLEAFVARVESLWHVFYSGPLKRLNERKRRLTSLSERASDEASQLQLDLNKGTIPQFVIGETVFSPPRGFWAQLVFYSFASIALIAAVFEWINFGWYLRFSTDSFPLGLAFAFSVFIIPAGEAAFLISLGVRERGRKIAATVQALTAIASVIGYIYFSLIRSDSSLASVLGDDHARFSLDSWRMLCQLLASLSVSALCMHAAFSLGRLKQTPSREYSEAKTEVKSLHRQADTHQKELATVLGEIERAEAVKQDVILFCTQKHEQLQTIQEHHQQQRNRLFSERP